MDSVIELRRAVARRDEFISLLAEWVDNCIQITEMAACDPEAATLVMKLFPMWLRTFREALTRSGY